MKTRIRKSFNPWKIAVGYITAVMAFVCTEYMALNYLPLSHWIKYDQVTVFRPVEGGQPIEVLSILHRYRAVDMIYNDNLFCKTSPRAGFRLYSSMESKYTGAPPSDETIVSKWTYTGAVPRKKSVCYLRSAVTVQLRYGIRPKPQIMQTYPFEVQERKWKRP